MPEAEQIQIPTPPCVLDVRIDEKVYRPAGAPATIAIQGLSFQVMAGEFVCILGPSGCGKTTALRILLGLDRQFTGTVDLGLAASGRASRIGAMFQEPRLLPWRTVEQNIRLALDPPERARSLQGLFARLDIEPFSHHYPGELSLGLERRVSLARALAVGPDLLVLDEPFVSLDDLAARQLRRLVAETAREKRVTTVMVTHNITEALELADRLILLAPRPTRMLASIALDLPRPDRTQGWIDSTRDDLARQFAETVAH